MGLIQLDLDGLGVPFSHPRAKNNFPLSGQVLCSRQNMRPQSSISDSANLATFGPMEAR